MNPVFPQEYALPESTDDALVIDMVHHNPGEKPFDSAFTDSRHLKSLGFTGQCFKHINAVIEYPELKGAPKPSSKESKWLKNLKRQITDEIRQAKEAGLLVFYHVDLFILPRRIVESFKGDLCDPKTGKISFARPFTRQLHRHLFAEIFDRFPDVDGIIIRVGENYLFDTPYHCGNTAVTYEGETHSQREISEFLELIEFLKEEICGKYNRYLIYRTWDIQNSRFHSNPDFYLGVTDQIPPHRKLLFSIKHTHIDFHRYARWNPCLGKGKHRQLVEVQCQREYEGKGAFPNFSSSGVIDGFPESAQDHNLRRFVKSPYFAGVYSWSRGGGWYGPYITRANEFWVDLNVRYLTRFLQNSDIPESVIFNMIAREDFKLQIEDQHLLYRIAKLSLNAVLGGKFCKVWDTRPAAEFDKYPTNQWMRDDVLGGWDLLNPVFEFLYQKNLGDEAIREKEQAVALWSLLVSISCELQISENTDLKKTIQASCQYGHRLFSFIASGWKTLYLDYSKRQGTAVPFNQIEAGLRETRLKWKDYARLNSDYGCGATLYKLHGWHWPGTEPPEGFGNALDDVERRTLSNAKV
jgi:hypothetical protein